MKTTAINSLNCSYIKKHFDVILLTCLIAMLGILSCIYIYGQKLNGPPIRVDGYGYYAYLPTVFIDHNLSFRLAKENEPVKSPSDPNNYGIGIHPQTGNTFNKYSPGTSYLGVPFFITADIFTQLTNGTRNGYSTPYQIMMIASGIFYLCVGSAFLFLTCKHLFGRRIALVSTLIIVFATNVFHYGTYDNSFSHIYSYAIVAIYIYLLTRLMDSKTNRSILLIMTGVCLGLIASIRIPNLVLGILVIPVFINRPSIKILAKDSLQLLVPFIVVLSPMLYYWWHATGSIITNPYTIFPVDSTAFYGFNLDENKYEGFTNLLHPEIGNFLFSVRKGLFFWSPVLVFAFISVFSLIKKCKYFGIATLAVLCINIYVCASWWHWPFGGSFGQRPFVDMMPLLGVALASGISYTRKFIDIKYIYLTMAAHVLLNLILMYSYWRGYVLFDNMTWDLLLQVPGHLCSGH